MDSNLTNIVFLVISMLFRIVNCLCSNFVKLILIVAVKLIVKATIVKAVCFYFCCRHSPPKNKWFKDKHPWNANKRTH